MKTKTLIQNVKVYDGTGGHPFTADVIIAGDKIIAIDRPNTCLKTTVSEVIAGQGLSLAPGFIDTHSHSDLEVLRNPGLEHVISQGITTELVGQDGSSVAPVTDDNLLELAKNMSPLAGEIKQENWWRSTADYFAAVHQAHPATKIEALIGHGTVRMAVMGSEDRLPTAEELKAIQELIAQGMREGAKGVSFGLIYPPGSYGNTAELIAVAQVVHDYDGIIMVHMRNEQDLIQQSLTEMGEVLKATNVRLQISHLKALGYRNWGNTSQILARLEEWQGEGYEVTFDQYPYAATCTGLKVVVPIWAYSGGEEAFQQRLVSPEEYQKIIEDTNRQIEARGGAAKIMIAAVATSKNKWMVGQKLDAIASRLKLGAGEAALYILQVEGPSVVAIYFSISDEDVIQIMRHPLHCVCTDGIIGPNPHPRAVGAFPNFLGHYCRDLKIMPWPEAIRRITSVPAHRLRLWDRGLIRIGLTADLVLFDEERIRATNSYLEPRLLSEGIVRVWVNGELRYCEKKE